MATISAAEAAAILGRSPGLVRHLAEVGRLPGRKIGRFWIFDDDEVRRWDREPRRMGRPLADPSRGPVRPRPKRGESGYGREIDYIVERHGANAANQPGTDVQILGLYQGPSLDRRTRSERLGAWADARGHIVYANQFLSARARRYATVADFELATELENDRQAWLAEGGLRRLEA